MIKKQGDYEMKLSALTQQELTDLTIEQINKIVFIPAEKELRPAIAAILLGGHPRVLHDRAGAAVKLYRQKLVSCIIPTGGVKWETDKGEMTEAEYLAILLEEMGVAKEDILLENDAATTRENLICSTLLIERHFHPRKDYHLYIVTSPYHVKRSRVLAEMYLPRNASYTLYFDEDSDASEQQWHKNEFRQSQIHREVNTIWKTVQAGDMPDIEF